MPSARLSKLRVLTEYELGRAMAAIESVSRLDKPIAEVGCRVAVRADLEHDLLACLESAKEIQHVLPWIRQVGPHLRFGYFTEPWVLRALDFLDRTDLAITDRDWISGLLFGYRPQVIQQFIERSSDPGTIEPRPTRIQNREEMARHT